MSYYDSIKNGKNIIIIEGADACGKSQLARYLQDFVDGKCHTIHSNFNPNLPKENHYRQHFLISKFVTKQFDAKHYTGNKLVILDRNYISDIVYGQIGYGSKGNFDTKLKNFGRMLKILSRNKDVNISIIYCRPEKSKFKESSEQREELLNIEQNTVIQNRYDLLFEDPKFFNLLNKYSVNLYRYDYTKDPNYSILMGKKE